MVVMGLAEAGIIVTEDPFQRVKLLRRGGRRSILRVSWGDQSMWTLRVAGDSYRLLSSESCQQQEDTMEGAGGGIFSR